MADKGDTYYCTWTRESDGTCAGWEIRRPKLRASAASPVDLMRELGAIIEEHYNDNEAALHFDPPLITAGDPAWFSHGLVEIAWNASFRFTGSASTAYADGRCNRCGVGLGPRTSTPLEVDELRNGTDGASSPLSNEPPPGYGMPGSRIIVSEQFLGCLTATERKAFQTREVDWSIRERRRFFEMIPQAFVPLGAIVGLDVDGAICNRCSSRGYGHGSVLGYCVNVACQDSIPTDPAPFFFAGSETDVHLYCTRDRWRSLAGTKCARGLTGKRLAVVKASEFDTNPTLGTMDEIAEFRRVHGFRVRFKPHPPK